VAPPILVGCCGFPVSQARYFAEFRAIEVNATFYQPPRLSTVERWRLEAPKDFQFAVKAWQLVTHPSSSPTYRRLTEKFSPQALARCGHFQKTPEVFRAWKATRRIALALKAKVVLLQTPTSFFPGADLLKAMYDFFKTVERDEFLVAWEPRGDAWKEPLVRQVCADLDLLHAVDPLHALPAPGRLRYFRLHGAYRAGHIVYGHRYSEEELIRLAGLCRGKPGYVFFNNSEMYDDARRFIDLLAEA
jgi:uncharacterized protein YecE (DUF72 family)